MNRMTIVIAAASTTLLALSTGTASAEVRNFSAYGTTRSAACTEAKYQANIRLESVRRYGTCDCSEDRSTTPDSLVRWHCSVDAYYERGH